MDVGVHLIRYENPAGTAGIGPMLADLGAAVEAAGIDNLSVMDHYLQMPGVGRADEPMLEGYTTLGFLAAHTTRATLQLLVTGVTYRHPGLLAKVVTTLDVLSGGRAVLGLGAAWYEQEHAALGVPYPPTAERFERLEETLQVVRSMLHDERTPYTGRHYRLGSTINTPAPLGRVPVMVGGGGERKTLRLVARYADACNLFVSPDGGLDTLRHKLEVLREHCEREGRDPDDVRRTISWSGDLDPADGRVVDALGEAAGLGVTEVHVWTLSERPVEWVQALGTSFVPLVHAL